MKATNHRCCKCLVNVSEKKTRKNKLETLKVIMADSLRPFEELVECPVCLSVPREGPVPACPVGKIQIGKT